MTDTAALVAAFEQAREELAGAVEAVTAVEQTLDGAKRHMTERRAAFEQARNALRARIDTLDFALPEVGPPDAYPVDPGAGAKRPQVDADGFMIDDGADYFAQEAAFARLVGAA